SGTWDGYQNFNGLVLATEHQFGDKRVYFTNVSVARDRPGLLGHVSLRTQIMILFLLIAVWMLVWGLGMRPVRHAHVPGEHGAVGGSGNVLDAVSRWRSYRGPPS